MSFASSITPVWQRTFRGAAQPGQSRISSWLGEFCVITLICLPILITAIRIPVTVDIPVVKLEVLALPIVFLVYLWLLLAGEARLIQPNGMFAVGALFNFSVVLSMLYSSTVLGETIISRDFLEIPKLWMLVVFFTITYEARLSETALRRLMNVLSWTTVPLCLYAWAQWADLGISHWLNDFYQAGQKSEAALYYARRVYSTMGNPNNFAELLTWLIAAFLLAALLFPRGRTRNILFAFICLMTLTMTGSRYGILNVGITLILIFAMNSARKLRHLALLLGLLPLFVGAVVAVSFSNQRNLERFQTLDNPFQTDSFRERADILWQDAIRDFRQSPLFGHGPAKNIYTGVITDSEYLTILKEYGVVGFLFYLAYFLYPLYRIWKGMRAARRAPDLEERLPGNFLVMRLSFIMVITGLVMNIGMSTFINFLLQPFFWMWLGLGVRSAQVLEEASRMSFALYGVPVGSLKGARLPAI